MSTDKENDNSLVSTGGSIEKLRPGSKQIMDGMVEDVSKVLKKKEEKRYKIGEYEFREADYHGMLDLARQLEVHILYT